MNPAIQAYNGARAAFRAMRLPMEACEDGAQDAALAVLQALGRGVRIKNPKAYGIRAARLLRAQAQRRNRWESFADGIGWSVRNEGSGVTRAGWLGEKIR